MNNQRKPLWDQVENGKISDEDLAEAGKHVTKVLTMLGEMGTIEYMLAISHLRRQQDRLNSYACARGWEYLSWVPIKSEST